MTEKSQQEDSAENKRGLVSSPQHSFLIAGIILGNIFPLYGVLFLGWELFEIFYIYWAENIVIGVFTWFRILSSGFRKGIGNFLGSMFLCAFFTVHYGMFCFGHGMIMTDIFYSDQLSFELTGKTLFLLPWLIDMAGYSFALAGIILVQAMAYISLVRKDKQTSDSARAIMFAPYGRIIVLHLTILVGGALSLWLGFPPAALIFLVVLKILFDLAAMNINDNVHNGMGALFGTRKKG